MKTKYKKITVAVHTAIMTSLICSALPSFASDTELYKAPQSSETTIMFMVDLSGSMLYCDNSNGTVNTNSGCSPNRVDKLKEGMIKLLQGSVSDGIEPLPDKLVVGLSDFSSPNRNGPFGRITIEAKPLGTTTSLGNKEIYRVKTPTTYMGTRTQTQTVYRQHTRSRTKTLSSRYGSWSNWGDWSGWSAWSGWTRDGNISDGAITLTKQRSDSSVVEECVDWEVSTIACKSWVQSTKTIAELTQYNSTENEIYTLNNWSPTGSSGWTDVGNVTPSSRTDTDTCSRTSGNFLSGYYCSEQKETETSKETKTQNRSQTATAVGEFVQTYTGTAYETHRKRMIRGVNALNAVGGTPTGYAFAEVAAYMMGQTTSGVTDAGSISGFSANRSGISGDTKYIAPASVTSAKQCNTQGIYFLTDGAPTYYSSGSSNATKQHDRTVLENFMKKTLDTKSSGFSCNNDSTLGKFTSGYSSDSKMTSRNGWDCIGAYTKALLDPTLNPAGVSIKTAVVGFGNDFSNKSTSDEKDADKWGILGGGGSYVGNNDQAVVDSVLKFLKKLQKYIPPVTTGSVTVPVDNLDTQNIQPWGYFPQFDPQPDSRVTTWIGNLKKYEVKNNILRDRNNNKVVDDTTGISVDDPNDFWADTSIKKTITKIKIVDGKEVEEDIEVRIGGALSQLKLGLTDTNIERKIFTDRKINEDGTVATVGDDSNLLQVKTADLKVLNDTNNFVRDPKRGYLAALFGYDISSAMARQLETNPPDSTAQTTFTNFLTNTNATLRQMGAVMHSKPLLITQEGKTKFDAATGDLSYESRDDLIVFGTTQGLLHVVRAGKNSTDSDAGKEVFTFVPSEMIEKQHQGFLDQKQQGIDLKYGIDGPWTAYTEYATRSGTSATAPVVSVKNGKQWLYGGLRMGGRSYYALDLSDVTSTSGTPKIKFKIDPQSAAAYSPLSYMGQSWSKPTLTWVKWKGERKLVMLVGGGYDDAYENLNHRPSSSKDKGAGVYMFDADDGSLLWWASSNVDTTSVDATQVADMKRSVVSQIKAIDRNNDGLTDHLYFGDLGGQLWRVDLDSSNAAGDTANVAKRVVRILDMSSASKVPRFYSTPSFSIHNSGNGLFGVVTIGSGNLSFPMSESDQSDALYVVYDKDVTKRNLSVLKDSELSTVDVSTSGAGSKKLFENTNGNTSTSLTNGGWYYPLATKNRILNDNVVIANDLYTSVFDATVDIDDVNCYGGVRGKSVAKQFCLPFGQCLKKDDSGNDVSDERPDDIDLGLGNIGISFGGIDKKRGLVLNLPTDKPIKTYQGKSKFISQRWYEY
ncbi:pilus assembly protein [Acinetobacter sp. YH12043]|uniref:pilus assembly protein n=1 Tax=Acinetobacter sp. YH12043 TaxID=2601050 RepID=UPI0015D23EFB|nr:PilC/PilY family type IV pilus protein [Acinetobacter sp. YH12043]